MTPRPKLKFWRRFRTYFRRVRIALWVLLLLGICALIYLNQVGLPDFVKRPLLQKLQARGIDLQFSRLRLRFAEGVVADNVTLRLGRAGETQAPRLSLSEIQMQLNWRALARLQFQIDGLVLHQGRLVWPVTHPDEAPRQLTAENIQARLRFLPGDQWELENFRAQFAGANIRLSGTVSNALALREWRFLQGSQTETNRAGVWQQRMRELADRLEDMRFASAPDLKILFEGDAKDLQSFSVRMMLSAPGAETPWGTVSQGRFTALLFPAAANQLSRAELSLDAAEARPQWEGGWAAVTNFHVELHFAALSSDTNQVQARLAAAAEQASSAWGSASNLQLSALWAQALTAPFAFSGRGELSGEGVESDAWEQAGPLRAGKALLLAHFARPATNTPAEDEAWAAWAKFEPYLFDWQCRFSSFESSKLKLDQISLAGNWHAPELAVTNFQVGFDPGRSRSEFEARASLNIATRALQLTVSSQVDPKRAASALPEALMQPLARGSWNAPPRLQCQASLTVPAWTNWPADWLTKVQPTLNLQGQFELPQGGAYQGVEALKVSSRFAYSNFCWHLPDLVVTLPSGRLEAEHRMDERTTNFYWRVHSTVDLNSLRPAIGPEPQRGLDLFTFTQPPVIDAEIQGNFSAPDRISFQGRVEMTNFTFRGESLSKVETLVSYSNRVVQFIAPRVQRGAQYAGADGLTADFNSQTLELTNGYGTIEPMVVAHVIGPNVTRVLEPYVFTRPPTARAYGRIPMHGDELADLHFDIFGGPFQWWKFNLPRVAGHVHWQGKHVQLSNVSADLYGGDANGFAAFDFRPEAGPDLQFSVSITNVNLQELIVAVSAQTNQLEGQLSGMLAITRGNGSDTGSLFGYGNLEVRDGLIWNIPLFGVFSPVLDSIVPGLGSSRAGAAAASFIITNGIVRSDDLEIDAVTVRLLYRGTVTLGGELNARVEAELLRDLWVVGSFFATALSPATKMFEYKVTGTLALPKAEPLYFIPKIFHPIRSIFHPVRSLREIWSGTLGSGGTTSPSPNAPARP